MTEVVVILILLIYVILIIRKIKGDDVDGNRATRLPKQGND